jgi:dolichol-phosphate mannosyltransferase
LATSAREYISRFWKFGIVGLSGVFVNQGLLMLLVGLFDFPTWLAGAIAIEISILTNWAINDIWTWRDKRTSPIFIRIIKYNFAAALTAFCVNYPLLLILSGPVGMNYAIANVIGIVLAAALNFLINHNWTYRAREA